MRCAGHASGLRGGAAAAVRLLLRGVHGREGRPGRRAGGRREAVPGVQDDDREDVWLQPHRLHCGEVRPSVALQLNGVDRRASLWIVLCAVAAGMSSAIPGRSGPSCCALPCCVLAVLSRAYYDR